MNKSTGILATAVTGMGLIAAGLVSIPSQGNAGVASKFATDRVTGVFALLEQSDFTTAGTTGSNVRTVAIGYQTDASAALLLRKPGAQSTWR